MQPKKPNQNLWTDRPCASRIGQCVGRQREFYSHFLRHVFRQSHQKQLPNRGAGLDGVGIHASIVIEYSGERPLL